jgi:membrane protein DedA with SNARE-associated domain
MSGQSVQRGPGCGVILCNDRKCGENDVRVAIPLAAQLVSDVVHVHSQVRHSLNGQPFDYAGLALAAFASWVGVPGPGEPVLIAAGVLAAQHKLDIVTVLLVAWVAATAGGIVGWLVGIKAGRGFVVAPGPLRQARISAVARGEMVFARFAVIAIVFTPSWVAGIHRVRAAVYLPTNAAAAALWAVGIGLGAYFVGPAVVDFVTDLGVVSAVGIGLFIVAGIVIEVRRRRAHPGPPGGPGA